MRRNEIFVSITLIRFADFHLSALAQYHQLKKVILKNADTARAMRIKKRLLFYAKHFQKFLHLVIQHTTVFMIEFFNFIIRSKSNNEVQQNFEIHFCVFLSLIKCYVLFFFISTLFIVFNIIMNTYSYKMHDQYLSVSMFCRRKFYNWLLDAVFESRIVFRILYRRHCFHVFKKVFEFIKDVEFCCSLLEKHVIFQFSVIEFNTQSLTMLRADAFKTEI